ncbi:MAG TPA: 3-deoxy-manno-octulosonate cytidylyltransferase [Bacteroidales bacterium]|nr:3-deoxy-manno-octulosonate cytidylyltransferase [Bacteroidales bacterium]
MLNFAGIIPARYASTRFPGKPLVSIKGKTMIERVYNQASKVFKHVAVATDDERIETEVIRFGGKVIMTSPNHQSGTDRCYEAACKLRESMGINFDVIVNIQGDEPFIQPVQFEKLIHCFSFPDTQIATLVKEINSDEDLKNPNHVKVVMDKNNRALYFSRSAIPYLRNKAENEWTKHHTFFTHIGIYAYRFDVLKEISSLSQSSLELAESLEQLRWLENGYSIRVEKTDFESISVDTPEDLEKINRMNLAD